MLFVFALQSCTSKEEFISFQNNLEQIGFAKESFSLTGDQYFIIVPGNGCPPCIYKAEQFLKEHYESQTKYIFVFTNYDSEKLLRIKLGDYIMESPNVFFDRKDSMYKSGFNSIYPVIVKINGNRLNKEYGSPQNQGIWETITL
ncbi:MAG: hypothetical protein HEP71_09890 [Roseivirga sp.]|nr:hypothetical protein [Roseivirga sp.]